MIFSEPFVNLMNPAGMMHDYGRFRASLTVNLDSVFIVTSAVVEHMIKRRTKGAIVSISSISAQGNEGQTAYSAAKAGVNLFRRFALMEHWVLKDGIDMKALIRDGDGSMLHMSDWATGCASRALCDAIVSAPDAAA